MLKIRHYLFFILIFIIFILGRFIYLQEVNDTTSAIAKIQSNIARYLPPPPPQIDTFVARPDLNTSLHQLPKNLEETVSRCRSAIVINWTKQTILYEKDSDTAQQIASLTKMATALTMFEQLNKSTDIKLDTVFKVTPLVNTKVAKGGEVDLDPRESFTLEDLFSFMIIHSANDAAYQIAYSLGKNNERKFIERMNTLCKEIGWKSFMFYNPHGLPQPNRKNNRGSAREVAEMSGILLEFPVMTKYSGMARKTIPIKGIRKTERLLINRNKLVYSRVNGKKTEGIMGMKTGTTQEAGYCISAVAKQNGDVIIVVLLGCPTDNIRFSLASYLLTWGSEQTIQ